MKLKQVIDKRFKEYIFFISEITTFILIYFFSLYSLWFLFPKELNIIKFILTLLIVSNFYNITKYFIYVRFVIWKTQDKSKNRKEEEI